MSEIYTASARILTGGESVKAPIREVRVGTLFGGDNYVLESRTTQKRKTADRHITLQKVSKSWRKRFDLRSVTADVVDPAADGVDVRAGQILDQTHIQAVLLDEAELF